MIIRALQDKIRSRLFKGKAILLFGPRQCGKTTLVRMLLQDLSHDHLYLNGNEANIREMLTNTTSVKLKALTGKNSIVFIDEAQRISDIGLTLKLFTDVLKDVQVIAAASSVFELAEKVNEPLTGRKYVFMLYPFSFSEMVQHHGPLSEKRLLNHRLVYGYYPEIVTKEGEEKKLLKLLADSYLFKDLLTLEQINKPVLLEKLVKALALKIGSEVSYSQLAQKIKTSSITVEKYIDLLEKAFVVFRLSPLNRNAPKEIKKGKKIYFWDCGIRNAIINNFEPLGFRKDSDALWENYVIAERLKCNSFEGIDALNYFWRTILRHKIDLVEEEDGTFKAFQCEWAPFGKAHFPQTFLGNYPVVEASVITPKNIDEFIS